jgi:hypothetical protein
MYKCSWICMRLGMAIPLPSPPQKKRKPKNKDARNVASPIFTYAIIALTLFFYHELNPKGYSRCEKH